MTINILLSDTCDYHTALYINSIPVFIVLLPNTLVPFCNKIEVSMYHWAGICVVYNSVLCVQTILIFSAYFVPAFPFTEYKGAMNNTNVKIKRFKIISI